MRAVLLFLTILNFAFCFEVPVDCTQIFEARKEEILKEPFAKIPYIVPTIENNLEIYGYVKNSPLEGKDPEELKKLEPQENMPENYTGSLEIYNKLKKYIYRGEAKTINGNTNPNYHGSIQKQQSQFLALLQTQNKYHG